MEVDVRGLSCPEPVMQVAAAIRSGAEEIVVLLSEAHSVANVKNYAIEHGYRVSEATKGFDYLLTLKK